jgi:hypothetical protein
VQQIASTKYFWDIYIRPLSSSLLSATLTLATCSIFPLASRKSISRVLPRHLRLPGRNLQVSPATNFTSTTENDPNHVDSLSVGPDPPPPPDIFGTMVPLHLRAPPPRSLASPPPRRCQTRARALLFPAGLLLGVGARTMALTRSRPPPHRHRPA